MSKQAGIRPEARGNDQKMLGERLRTARKYLGFSQDDVAAYLGVSRSALSLIESGQRKVDALELAKIAKLYKRPLSYFTDEEAEEAPFAPDVAHLARKASALAPDDRAELARFADFLRASKQRKRD